MNNKPINICVAGVIILFLLSVTGCHSVSYTRTDQSGEKIQFSSSSLFTKKQIKDVNYGVTRNGSRTFRLKGYSDDQAEAVGSAVSAALQAYIASQPPAKPNQ